MSGPRGGRRRALLWLALAALLLYAMAPEAPSRRIGSNDLGSVWLVDHGFHVGLIVPRETLKGLAILEPFPTARWIEFGWGDAGFYRAHSFRDVGWGMLAEALFWPSPSVAHVVAVATPPTDFFPIEYMRRIELDAEGRAALRAAIEAATADPAVELGRGLYGDSRFFRGAPAYHAFYVCNHWLSDALNAAGLPSSSFWSTAPAGMIAELEFRGGLATPVAP